MSSTVVFFCIIYGIVLISAIVILYLVNYIFKQSKGTDEMQGISNAIKEGAMAFLKRQYKTIAMIAIAALFVIVAAVFYGNWRNLSNLHANDVVSQALNVAIHTGVAFITGAICSALSGFIGMFMSINSNVRSAEGARSGLNRALQIAFKGGAVTGLAVTTLSLFGVATLFLLYGGAGDNWKEAPTLIIGFGFGASLVALFAQLGGGIYTKAADVGADLVGKIEAGIPEDDPRNPAVIADLVGDNVGDCAGRGADLFESTAAENIGAMILGVGLYPVFGINGILFPLVARALGILASIVGIFLVKVKDENKDPMKALNKGYFITAAIMAVAFIFNVKFMLVPLKGLNILINNWWLYGCAVVGILLGVAFVYITNYYTSYSHRPVKAIAKSCETGAATNIITGISMGMESVALPVVFICLAVFGAYHFGVLAFAGVASVTATTAGLYGTAIATMGMLATCTYVLAMDTFGPITDNAGGIIEMSGAPEEIRYTTDKLDACGNTTKALTKGYAVGSAALATFLLFSAYLDQVKAIDPKFTGSVDIGKPAVFIAGFIAVMVVFLFSSTAIRAVGNAAQYVIMEVRRQFKEIPGIMQGTAKPDYATCVDIVAKGALHEMVLPGIIVVAVPILVGVLLGREAAAGYLMMCTIGGVVLALFLNNGGGAWDNAKKLIEMGEHGGKNSEAHKAAVVGDTVGDPFKDTAGPSLHVLIKLTSTITLLFVSLFFLA
jgi:K(+)-stimulated pyrophosphate-energized sodium pump